MGRDAQRADSAYVGSAWRIQTVTTPETTLTLPRGLNASLSFGADGRLLGGDGVNAYSGQYEPEEDGYRPTEVAMTLRGYLGDDVHIRAAMRAVREVTNEGALVRVDLEVDDDSLVLTANGYELRCMRRGPAVGPVHIP